MYSDVFCKVYNEFGWNYYPEIFGEQLLIWLSRKQWTPRRALDLACGTGVLCRMLRGAGMEVRGMDLSAGMIGIARSEGRGIQYDVADMVTYRPPERVDLVTCTGDAINHIPSLRDVGRIFENVYESLEPGGWFVFDLLNESEVSTGEPFEMDFGTDQHIWFQMTRPAPGRVNLKIRLHEHGRFVFEENIRETLHDPAAILELLTGCGFRQVSCGARLLEDSAPGTTWFVTAQK